MTEVRKNYGICCTCNHLPKCLSFGNSRRENIPVLQCEQFDDSSVGPAGSFEEKAEGGFRKKKVPIGILPLMGDIRRMM